MYECCICNKHARRTLAGIMRHIREVHPHFEGTVRCGVDGCPTTTSSYESLRQHMYRKHKSILKYSTSLCDPQRNLCPDIENYFGAESLDTLTLHPVVTSDTTNKQHVSLEAARFILKVRDGTELTQTVMDGILRDTKNIVQCTLDVLERSVIRKLEGFTVLSSEKIAEIRSIFTASSLRNPFAGLETYYQQEKFFQEEFNYVPPVERVLGQSYKLSPSGSMTEVNDCCYDVPLFSALQALLNCGDVCNQVFNSHKLESGKLRDYCDGEQFRSHPLFKKDKCALQIMLYYDDLEVCNPLGSKENIHKVGLFYFMLGNIDPKLRSNLQSIQLVTVLQTELMETYTVSDVLGPFMTDIRQLESDLGVPFLIDGKVIYLRGTLTVVYAGNPAANLVAGYKSLNSAFQECRTCMAVETDMQSKFHEADFVLRSHETPTLHCSSLDGPLHNHMAVTYGIMCNSILNSSRYFNVVEGMSPDIVHDILQGTLQLHLKWLLKYLIEEERMFTLDTLSERMLSFYYGQSDAQNRPAIISYQTLSSPSNTVKQSSSQAWCLGRFLPLLIGDLVPEHDEKWNNYLELLKIMEHTFATVTTAEKLDYLQMLIQDYLASFTQLYPAKPLVPKMHYLVHMPSWMRRCGPLIRNWYTRYETKKVSQVLGNFTNIAKTVAIRHQRYVCYKMTCGISFLGGEEAIGPGCSVVVDDLEYADPLLEFCAELTSSSTIHRVAHAEISGTKYHKGSIMVCTVVDDEPVFGKILDIVFTVSGDCLFVLEPYIVTTFNTHFNAYEVHPLETEYLVCRHKDFADYHVLSISKSFSRSHFDTNFVCLKCHVFV